MHTCPPHTYTHTYTHTHHTPRMPSTRMTRMTTMIMTTTPAVPRGIATVPTAAVACGCVTSGWSVEGATPEASHGHVEEESVAG